MKGIEYVVVPAQGEPFVFVICKQRRESPQSVLPIAHYYLIEGIIFFYFFILI